MPNKNSFHEYLEKRVKFWRDSNFNTTGDEGPFYHQQKEAETILEVFEKCQRKS